MSSGIDIANEIDKDCANDTSKLDALTLMVADLVSHGTGQDIEQADLYAAEKIIKLCQPYYAQLAKDAIKCQSLYYRSHDDEIISRMDDLIKAINKAFKEDKP